MMVGPNGVVVFEAVVSEGRGPLMSLPNSSNLRCDNLLESG